MKNETVINVNDRHPEVTAADLRLSVNPENQNLRGGYWREAVVQELAKDYHKHGAFKGQVTGPAVDWADMMVTLFENDNGEDADDKGQKYFESFHP